MFAEQTDFRAVVKDFGEKLILRWLDVKSGRWIPPAPSKRELQNRNTLDFAKKFKILAFSQSEGD